MLHIPNFARIATRLVVFVLFVALVSMAAGISFQVSAAPFAAPQRALGLGAAGSYSVLGKAGVTNAGNSVLSGNVGADELGSITGFPPGSVGGSIVSAPAVNGAEADAQAAYLALTAMGPGSTIGPNLTGLTLHPGVYSVGDALLPGELTLDGKGTYIFLMSSGLTSSGDVNLINGANPCNVFWQVTSSAALTGGSFVGTIIADTSITLGDGVDLNGRALALTGNVTLINDSIHGPSCGGGGVVPTPAPVTPVPGTPQPGGGPAHVGVVYACLTDGRLEVRVGLSAGVTVSGLGPDITSAVDTGNDRIFVYLSPGHYEWNATPPAGKSLLDVDHGVIDVPICGSGTVVVEKVVGLPKTGGAPLQSDIYPWSSILPASIIAALMAILSNQASR